jgi:hypothetical protein
MIPEEARAQRLQLRMKELADALDHVPPRIDQGEIEEVLAEFEDLGAAVLMTPAESARVSLDNLPIMLEEAAGIRALRDGIALGARVLERWSDGEVRDWWGGTDPEVMLVNDIHNPETNLFYEFGRALIHELSESRNLLAVPGPDIEHFDPEALWPPVYSVVTTNRGCRDWTFSWGGQLIWWEPTRGGIRVELQSVLGIEAEALFPTDAMGAAAHLVADWIQEPPGEASGSFISVNEHRAIEVVLLETQQALETAQLSPQDRLQTDLLLQILRLQLRAPQPDRTIIGRALKGVATFAGGVLVGVASTYMVGLLAKFGIPPP